MKPTRFFELLPPVQILDLDGTPVRDATTGVVVEDTHEFFIRQRTVDNAFVSDTPMEANTVHWNMAAIVSGETIRALVRDKKVGDIIALEEDDWLRLKRAVEKGVYNLRAASHIPFMRAITGATTEDPRKAAAKVKP